MSNLRGGFKVQGQPLSAAELDKIADADPDDVEGAEALAKAIAARADLVVRAGLELTLDAADMSVVELEALAQAREKQRDRDRNLLAVSIAAAIRTDNLAALLPDDLGLDVQKAKFMRGFEERAWKLMNGDVDV